MNIGIAALDVVPGRSGGVETYARELVRALARVAPGDTLTLFARDSWARQPWVRDSGIRVESVALDDDDEPRARLWAQSWLPLAAARRRVELLHHVTPFACLPWPGRQLVTVHDLISDQFYRRDNLRRRPLRTRLRDLLFAASLRRARRVLVPTETVRCQLVREHRLSPAHVVVTPEAPRPLAAVAGARDDGALLARHGLRGGEYLFTVSRFLPHKNLAALVAAHLRSGSPRTLAVAGVPDFPAYAGPVLDEVRARLAAPAAAGRVRLLGFVGDDELPALYAGARLFVFPSLAEGFGLPPLEALRMGATVLASDIGVHREVLGDGAAYFRVGSIEHLAARLVELAEDGRQRAALAPTAAALLGRYSWDETARRTVAAYRDARGEA